MDTLHVHLLNGEAHMLSRVKIPGTWGASSSPLYLETTSSPFSAASRTLTLWLSRQTRGITGKT